MELSGVSRQNQYLETAGFDSRFCYLHWFVNVLRIEGIASIRHCSFGIGLLIVVRNWNRRLFLIIAYSMIYVNSGLV